MTARNIRPADVEYSVERVTPKIAADFLSVVRPDQRGVSPTKVREYARLMREGKWFEGRTGQPIGFDVDGYLIQGQHRLQAMIAAGVTLRLEIAWGLPREAFEYMDQGFRRGAQQFIGKSGTLKAAALRQIRYMLTDPADRGRMKFGTDNRASMSEVLADYETWKDVMDPLCAPIHRAYNHTNIRETSLLAVLTIASRTRYAEHVDAFLDGVTDGSGLSRTDPRLHLRNRFASRTHAVDTGEALAYVVKAWNAYAAGKQMGVLRQARDDEIPGVLGFKG